MWKQLPKMQKILYNFQNTLKIEKFEDNKYDAGFYWNLIKRQFSVIIML